MARGTNYLSMTFLIKGQRQLEQHANTLDRIAKHDGKTYELFGEIKNKHRKQRQYSKKEMSMFIKDATMPYKDFTLAQALVMQESFEGKTAFSEAVYGGNFIPSRGRASYDVYKVGQAQRLKYAVQNSSFFLSLR